MIDVQMVDAEARIRQAWSLSPMKEKYNPDDAVRHQRDRWVQPSVESQIKGAMERGDLIVRNYNGIRISSRLDGPATPFAVDVADVQKWMTAENYPQEEQRLVLARIAPGEAPQRQRGRQADPIKRQQYKDGRNKIRVIAREMHNAGTTVDINHLAAELVRRYPGTSDETWKNEIANAGGIKQIRTAIVAPSPKPAKSAFMK
ncbi:hypothetical protein [Acidithiobacillus sp. IBUN Pt1247-S3]|uniref:hypothetical protein n=1 Tax=Acidithiobacillus sp. IBUN Pt1247-S3 TaxID=3166642 RepID=UPI0034E37BF4